MKTPVLTVRLEPDCRLALERMAKEAGKTRSDIIREAVMKAIRADSKQTVKQPVLTEG